ncbi:glutamine-hydrolyzing carbamoyl-phosphate synthase small subunit [Novosphingobium sp. MMS21-SN21R]|uniref:glutamine-hydrolyzing carbamoyl-phosphate synthase small subunit n=1 Tax=Novosphingobium sp. MMS21-SN21R TaxID=2969298 RepID=UPI002884499F|nr:glutamine-hydrolyzing carbamoyl-phosphate synthase small subunit [Novosphingobium sp. MMS21-SN21R]MDT0507845.1 glutamine-hydrolyzing carbamoyl-phosphate synthase small subunit [Novosphingobium sp. MMS21-SN21R]
MADPALSHAPQPDGATGVLVLADGSVAWGRGFGATGSAVGEVCFNTAITGYQEVMTDPSYAGQVVTFTFPHIGNVGTNPEDMESHDVPGAVGCVVREDVTDPANFRSAGSFQKWMEKLGKIGISGLDTRALTRRIRMSGAPNAVIAHDPKGQFDIPALIERAREWPGLEGMDLARVVTRESQEAWEGSIWKLGEGFEKVPFASSEVEKPRDGVSTSLDTNGEGKKRPHVVAIDYGAKDNIFRSLVAAGAAVTVVPAQTSLETILELKPDGVFLSNGPGDPAATGAYAVPVIQKLLEADMPVFGICLGHQMLALAAGARTTKMHQGHRGANHPVKRMEDGVVEITSMNHGFAVDNTPGALGDSVEETHVSLFDGSNCGIAVKGKKAFGVQYHPEASPGPQDSFYLFEKFVGMLG